jgi:hypothetical protein
VTGATANDFTNRVTYTVTAADGTTQDYLVTVYLIGKSYKGGKLAYILQSGDAGYDPLVPHGLIVTAAEVTSPDGDPWSNIQGTAIGAAAWGTAIGTGQANTTAIVSQVDGTITCTGGAAYICDRLVQGGYDDWYLPSRQELDKVYEARGLISGMTDATYWSSTECGVDTAYLRNFVTGWQIPWKWQWTDARAVRSF